MTILGTAAVIGLGYVGLPLAREAVRAGWAVIGVDVNSGVVEQLLSGRSHVDDISDGDVEEMLELGLRPTSDFQRLTEADVIVICVPTPLSKDGGPDLGAVKSAAGAVAENIQRGQLVILESTTYPGTTEEVLVPILTNSGLGAGHDIHVAFSPERIDPGNSKFGVQNTPKVVGGLTETCTERAAAFYSTFINQVVRAKGLREAEMTKLLENTYRHVNIALVNEMARFSHLLEIDLWDAIRCASTKPFGFQPFFPGPGVGGHCIPIDPNYLAHRVRTHLGQPFRFVELAQEINSGMPAYVARRAQDLLNDQTQSVRGSRVLIVGVTYKADVSDQRESPAIAVALALRSLGAELRYLDPYVPTWSPGGISVPRSQNLVAAASEVDLVILLQNHGALDLNGLSDLDTLTLDTRGVLEGPNIQGL